MEDPEQGRELSQRRASREPRRSYLEARVSGSQGNTHTHRREVVVHSLQSGLGMESRRVALPLDCCVSEGTLKPA